MSLVFPPESDQIRSMVAYRALGRHEDFVKFLQCLAGDHRWKMPHSRRLAAGGHRRGCATVAHPMHNKLERRYGHPHLHFVTCSCYRRRPLLRCNLCGL